MTEVRERTLNGPGAGQGASGLKHDASSAWGANFWVTIRDPQTQALFYACPATGECKWDPPENNFVLPANTDGEWWELSDESRGGIPYFYHTKTQETVWIRPEGFVIPLGMIQNSTLGKRLSQTTFGRRSLQLPAESAPAQNGNGHALQSLPESSEGPKRPHIPSHAPPLEHKSPRRLASRPNGHSLPPIPASPNVSDVDGVKQPDVAITPHSILKRPEAIRSRSSSATMQRSPPPLLNLDAAAELLLASSSSPAPTRPLPQPGEKARAGSPLNPHAIGQSRTAPSTPTLEEAQKSFFRPGARTQPSSPVLDGPPPASPMREKPPPSPRRPIPDVPRSTSPASLNQKRGTRARSVTLTSIKSISFPIVSDDNQRKPSPLRQHAKPLLIDPPEETPTRRLSSGQHRVLPEALAADIKRFAASDYAHKFFSTHKKGFLIRRKIPVDEMMVWQKAPLAGPLLVMNSSLHKDATNVFKVIQRVMGDRERDKPVGVRGQKPSNTYSATSSMSSVASTRGPTDLFEEERWLLEAGVTHIELRDEIYCQLIKQLSENPHPESAFKGWQLLCVLVITFPPSKYFKDHLKSFLESRVNQQEGKIGVMAQYCLHRIDIIMWKGPRGKAPTCDEIEVASDAAFNPSVFGESLVAIYRLQQRTYPDEKVPIVLPFLSDGILAFGGRKQEGIFRIPGDQDAVSELRLRIDRGHYHLERIEDCHVLASLFKTWLRELQEPVIPDKFYNDCLVAAEELDKCVDMVRRLPEINRRVVLHVISFLQLFTPESVSQVTKMTAENLAKIMTPNLLRAKTNNLDVAFRNNHFENLFVLQLIKHLDCNIIDDDYKPMHGQTAAPRARRPRG